MMKTFVQEKTFREHSVKLVQVVLCDFFQLGELTKECKKVADGYVHAFLDDFAKNVNPKRDCSAVRLCHGNSEFSEETWNGEGLENEVLTDESQEESVVSYVEDRRPSICKTSMTSLQSHINNFDIDKTAIRALASMCSSLNVASELCDELISGHVTNAFDFIKSSEIEDICDTLHYHVGNINDSPMIQFVKSKLVIEGSRVMTQISPDESNVNGQFCMICEMVLGLIKTITTTSKSVVEMWCHILPKTIQGECRSAIDAVFVVIDKIVNDIDPLKACHLVRLCGDAEFNPQAIAALIMDNTEQLEELFDQLKPIIKSIGGAELDNIF